MMLPEGSSKVTARHLRRSAYLYVRQSSLRQVMENTESTERQYALRQRAVQLGWSQEQVVVIDSDLGQSGASAADREGFQRLVSEVGLGRAGLVLGLEVSRLARNNADWHRLLEICALTDTLLLDEDGLYDPAHFNDRLVLGLKGTMSEAELHVLRARLRGGIVNKARRGELQGPLPLGFQYDAAGKVVFDPDRQVQESLRLVFDTFRRTGSATATVKAFRDQGLSFPRRVRTGVNRGELLWGPLLHSRVLWLLHNPRYAGAFFFGRSRQRKRPGAGMRFERLPRTEWVALFPGAHPGYLTWEEFEENQRRLQENARALGLERKKSPPREGPALLQGLVVCGQCGERMTVRYHTTRGQLVPDYACQRHGIERALPICQTIPGGVLDEAVGELLLATVTPLTLEVALAVEQELTARLDQAVALRRQHCERLRYEADLARRRYLQVDPDNRLVADELERDWNDKLRAHRDAVEARDRKGGDGETVLTEAQRDAIRRLATDFPRLWKDPRTPQRERKRMARLIVEDVTLVRQGYQFTAAVRFRGGTATTLTLSTLPPAWKLRQTPTGVIAEIDRLLAEYTPGQIAEILNRHGVRSGQGRPFHRVMIQNLIRDYALKDRYTRLRDAGMLTGEELVARLGIQPSTLPGWRQAGLVSVVHYNDKNQCLYVPPGADAPVKGKHKALAARLRDRRRPRTCKATLDYSEEVQYEA